MDIVLGILLVLALTVCWLLTLVGLPGNWLIVVCAGLFFAFGPSRPPVALGLSTVAATAVFAALGEIAELVAGAAGAKRAGGSRRSAVLALAGSIVGGFVGLLVGLPIPLIGPLVAAILFAAVGALVGAGLGERWKGRTAESMWRVGWAAFQGRLWGTLVKAIFGIASIAAVIVGLAR